MAMKVGVFTPHYNSKHRLILGALAHGIERHAEVVIRDVCNYEPCDVAVIFGVAKYAYKPTMAKAPIMDRHTGRNLLVVESAFCKRGEYWQIGWGGFAGGADFRNENMPRDRWRAMGVKTKPWQRRPDGPVVVCGQLPRDTQVQDTDHLGWCRATVKTLRRQGHDVLFRPHPRMADAGEYGVPENLIDTRPLPEVLGEARCVVTWNSTMGVDAALAGVPMVACDAGSMAWPIASHDLTGVVRPRFPSRRSWLAGLAYAQWNIPEMKAGEPWRHLTR